MRPGGGAGRGARGGNGCFPPAGVRLSQQQEVTISYTAGTLSFLDTPTVYRGGSPVRGKVSGRRPISPRGGGRSETHPWCPHRSKLCSTTTRPSPTHRSTCLRGRFGRHGD